MHVCTTPLPSPAADLVHVCWGASKDLCGSGLRLGVLLSGNAALNQALDNLGLMAAVPGPLQLAAARLLGDRKWMEAFLNENRRRLAACYTQLSGVCACTTSPVTIKHMPHRRVPRFPPPCLIRGEIFNPLHFCQ